MYLVTLGHKKYISVNNFKIQMMGSTMIISDMFLCDYLKTQNIYPVINPSQIKVLLFILKYESCFKNIFGF